MEPHNDNDSPVAPLVPQGAEPKVFTTNRRNGVVQPFYTSFVELPLQQDVSIPGSNRNMLPGVVMHPSQQTHAVGAGIHHDYACSGAEPRLSAAQEHQQQRSESLVGLSAYGAHRHERMRSQHFPTPIAGGAMAFDARMPPAPQIPLPVGHVQIPMSAGGAAACDPMMPPAAQIPLPVGHVQMGVHTGHTSTGTSFNRTATSVPMWCGEAWLVCRGMARQVRGVARRPAECT